jgi:DNA-binding beta-propeller fold protein YncE
MGSNRRFTTAILVGSIVISGSLLIAARQGHRAVSGAIWVANRGAHTIRGFDAATGGEIATIAMAPSSQPGDLAYAKGRLYVAEEFGTPPAIAIVDPDAAAVVSRITLPAGSRPHHAHASHDGTLVAFGLYGTDLVGVVDTHSDLLLGPWDSDPATTNARVHAAVFSPDGSTIYLASDATGEVIAMDPRTGSVLWRMAVPAVHEMVVTHNGKRAYASRRTANMLAVIDLEQQTYTDVPLAGTPDTLQLSANEKLLTVGLRASPARLAVVDTATFTSELVTLSAEGETTTIAGHQWTSPSGRYTFASYEGGANPGVAVIDHFAGNTVVQRLAYPGRPHGVTHARP